MKEETSKPKRPVPCWVDGCRKDQVPLSLYCAKHDKSSKVHKGAKAKIVASGPNIPNT